MNKIKLTASTPDHIKRLVPLFFIIFIDSLAYFLVIPVLLRLFLDSSYHILSPATSLATRDLLYGVTVALSALAFIISSPIVGNLSDRFGRKTIMSYCLIAAIIGFVLPIIGILSNHLSLILLGRFIGGISSGSQPVAQAAIADFTMGKRKAFYLSLIAFAMTLAMVLGPIAGGYLSDSSLVSWFDATTPYWLGSLLAIVNLVLLLTFFDDDLQVIDKKLAATWQQRLSLLWQVLCKPPVLGLLFLFILLEIAWSQYYQASYLFLQREFYYSTNLIGIFVGLIGLWMSLGLTVIFRIFIRFIAIERFLVISYFGVFFGLLGCLITGHPALQWIFVAPAAIFTGTAYTCLITLMSNHTAVEHQGWVLGTASMLLGFAWMLTGFLAGISIEWFTAAPIVTAVSAIIIGVFYLKHSLLKQLKATGAPG